MESWRHLGIELGWEWGVPSRDLHACFLRRSSADPETVPPEGRPNLAETSVFRRGMLGPAERVARRVLMRGPAASRETSAWKAEKYLGGVSALPSMPRVSFHEPGDPHAAECHRVATYEWPGALDLVLEALAEQSNPHFAVVVADDGSGTRPMPSSKRWQAVYGDRLVHSWQVDDGYRRAKPSTSRPCTQDPGSSFSSTATAFRGASSIRSSELPRCGWFLASKRLNLGAELFPTCAGATVADLALVSPTLARLGTQRGVRFATRSGSSGFTGSHTRPSASVEADARVCPSFDGYGSATSVLLATTSSV